MRSMPLLNASSDVAIVEIRLPDDEADDVAFQGPQLVGAIGGGAGRRLMRFAILSELTRDLECGAEAERLARKDGRDQDGFTLP